MPVSLLRESIDQAQVPRGRDLTPAGVDPEARPPLAAVLGLGEAGLRSAVALQRAGMDVHGVGSSNQALLAAADAILVCVAAAADDARDPGLRELSVAAAAVCRHARRGQTIVLTATSYVGTTRDLLVEPLGAAGFTVGADICVAFSPPAAPGPGGGEGAARLLGGATELCARRAAAIVGALAPALEVVGSAETAEAAALELRRLRASAPASPSRRRSRSRRGRG